MRSSWTDPRSRTTSAGGVGAFGAAPARVGGPLLGQARGLLLRPAGRGLPGMAVAGAVRCALEATLVHWSSRRSAVPWVVTPEPAGRAGGKARSKGPEECPDFIYDEDVTEFFEKELPGFPSKWSRPSDIRAAAPASAPGSRVHAGRARRPGGAGALGAVPAGERPPRAEAVPDRRAGQGPVRAGRGAAAAPAAEPPGPAGDRGGRGAARAVVRRPGTAAPEGRRPGAQRRARAPDRAVRGAAQAAHPAHGHPGRGAGGQRRAPRRDARARQLLRRDRARPRRRPWSPSVTGAGPCPRGRCWLSSAITGSRSGTRRISRGRSGR